MDNQTLSPCLLEKEKKHMLLEIGGASDGYQIGCLCGVRGPSRLTIQAAASAWNALPRSSDTEPPKLSERDVLRAQMAATIASGVAVTAYLEHGSESVASSGLEIADAILSAIEADRAVTDTKENA